MMSMAASIMLHSGPIEAQVDTQGQLTCWLDIRQRGGSGITIMATDEQLREIGRAIKAWEEAQLEVIQPKE